MGPIIPAHQPRPNYAKMIGDQLAGGIRGYLEKQSAGEALRQEDEALKRMGYDLSGLSPEMKKVFATQMLKGENTRLQKEQEMQFLNKLLSGNKKSDEKEIKEKENERNIEDASSRVENLEEDEILEAEFLRHGLGSTLQNIKSAAGKKKSDEEKEVRRRYEADRTYHSKTSDPILAEAEATLKNEQAERGLEAQMRRDVASGETSGIFPFLVDRLGLESFRNPESARFTNEVKNKFVESLNDIPGARPNMFIERFLSNAQPQLGRSIEANMSVMDLDSFLKDLKFERAKKIREVAKEDRANLGYVKNDVLERADERMGNYANQRQEEMAYDIRKRHEDALEDDADLLNEIISGSIPEGTPLTLRSMRLLMIKNGHDSKKAVQEAKKLKMTFPNEKTYGRYED